MTKTLNKLIEEQVAVFEKMRGCTCAGPKAKCSNCPPFETYRDLFKNALKEIALQSTEAVQIPEDNGEYRSQQSKDQQAERNECVKEAKQRAGVFLGKV